CPDRGAKPASFYVLRYTPMVSVLVEVGFICNPNIEANLRDPEVRQAISETLGKAIIQYLKAKQIIE
ncbi:MAG: N-acetylmuramoyl-L-alanine amidase, partial [Candidatus Omnitrophica bacterium]|nr:N-acetylmuramoyl-L-alanine amidase [Candidatus Omnitrophota bacterium]